MTDHLTQCSNCRSDLRGEPFIADPQTEQPHEIPYLSQAVGVEIPAVMDDILFYTCPFCGFAWAKATPCPTVARQAELHVWKWNRQNRADLVMGAAHGAFA